MQPRCRIVIFTRYPVAGKTKTRLIPAIGARAAAALHREMAGYTILTARAAVSSHIAADLEIRYSGARKAQMQAWLGKGASYVDSAGPDLGRRMHEAFIDSEADGFEKTVIIGTDCPGITREHLQAALEGLNTSPVVLGPAQDGGYYLIGLRKPEPDLFCNIAWGTPSVLQATRAKADSRNLAVHLLPPLADVDQAENLCEWEAVRPPAPDTMTETRISVILPTLNEASGLERVLQKARAGADEIIIADGGSTDGTPGIAQRAGAVIVRGHGNRAGMLNAAALQATGNTLLFLHADTELPDGFKNAVARTLCRKGGLAGAFSFRIDGPSPSLRCIERFTNLRSRLFGLPYGDQALFMHRRTFFALGGFSNIPILDDFDLVQRLRRRGRVVTCPEAVLTSRRRWEQVGAFKTTLINQRMIAGYFAGGDFQALEHLYRRSSER